MGFISGLADFIDYMMFGEDSKSAARLREEKARFEREAQERFEREEAAKQAKKSKGGMHVGRPHTSQNDQRVHVTSTLRNDKGKKVRSDKHHTSLGAIAYGQANYDTRGKRK